MTTMTEKGIVITRIFDAGRERVWRAWTNPIEFMSWWGPKGFTSPAASIEFRVGGWYLNCMRGPGPDGVVKDYWSTGEYREIVPLEKIVYSDSFADEKGNPVPASYYGMPGEWPLEMTVTVTFNSIGDKTEMILQHEGIPAGTMTEECREGWSQSFDKLEEILK